MKGMRLHHTLIILLFICSSAAQAFELIMIQGVSSSKRTFVTRNGKRQGLIVGLTGTFTADDVSVLAKVVSVTGNFAQWELVNPDASIPFEKGTIVTYYHATEYIWALAPESERRKYIKSLIPDRRQSWIFKAAISRGISESVSEAPASQTNRGGVLGELYYEHDLPYNFAVDIGVRYEREIINYKGASYTTNRSLLMGDVLYYFDTLRDYIPGKLFIGAGMGYGVSSTKTTGLIQSGVVGILPTAKIGITLPFNQTWEFVMDAGYESIQTKEEQQGGREQTTTQTNFKSGVGLRRYL